MGSERATWACDHCERSPRLVDGPYACEEHDCVICEPCATLQAAGGECPFIRDLEGGEVER